MPRSFRSFGAINRAPPFVPFAEHPDRSYKLGDTGKLAGLLKRSIVLGDNGDRPDFAFLLPLAHQVCKGSGDLLARHALAAQAFDALDHLGRRRLA